MKCVEQLGLSFVGGIAVWMAVLTASPEAQANVFASNIKLNGALSSVTNSAPGIPVTITYILNEPATLGTTIAVLQGPMVVDSISIAAGNPGTLKGTNSVVWGGTNSNGANTPGGTYSVSITPAASGYTNWTQTSTDTNTGYYVFAPRGIAVDTKTNSLYYGRVFLANAATGPNPATNAGDVDGILKVNSDGSLADEGQGTGGYSWEDDGFYDSPRFLRYGTDDRIYGLDNTGTGVLIACDVLMTTNATVFSTTNWQNNPSANTINNGFGWSCFDVLRPETTSGWIFMGDGSDPGVGYWGWQMTNGEANPTNTVGTQLVAVGGELSAASGGLMMDVNSNAYVASDQHNAGNPDNRVMLFTNWNGMTAFTNGAAWVAGSDDNTFQDNYDMAIDSRANPTYVALALADANPGGLRVLYATNGQVVSNATTGQVLTNLDYTNSYYGVAWDAVGNLYGASASANKWRVFSPPGTNQATTVAVETIKVIGPTSIMITGISISNNAVIINFTGATSDTTTNLTVLSSATAIPASSYSANFSASITQLSPGVFQASVPMNGAAQFYRIKRGASAPLVRPTITSLTMNGGTATINFIGSASDSASAFTLLSSGTPTLASSYAAASGASISLVSPGVFQATVAASATAQYYRIKR